MVSNEGLWFTREGVDAPPLGKWQLWFRPIQGVERRHGTFQDAAQAQAAADALNELSRHHLPEQQANGDPGPVW